MTASIKGLPYEIIIDQQALEQLPANLSALEQVSRYIIVTDETTRELFGEKLLKDLREAGHRVDLISVPPGEKSKSREVKAMVEDQMFDLECKRDTMIIALGGGVVGDLAGFVAATFMRGIPYVQVPTTLLAMVDSSVGGKTAIDTKHGKNLIGAFWPPVRTIIDVDFLSTLPQKFLVDGLVEAVKIFMTNDAESFQFAKENMDKILAKDLPTLKELIRRAVQNKADVVSRDEREGNERAVLNFGHTVGHAMELLSDFKLSHGHAVALGILVESKLSMLAGDADGHNGYISKEDFNEVQAMIESLGYNPKEILDFDADKLLAAMELDKKSRGHVIKYVVLTKIGEVLQDGGKFSHILDREQLNPALNGW